MESSRCRGLGTLVALVALAGCAGLAGGGPDTQPSVPVTPVASPSTPGAGASSSVPVEPAPSAMSPTPSATPTVTASPTPSRTPTPTRTTGTLQVGAVPLVEGTPQYRSVLSFDEPTWGPGRVSMSYQWQRDGAAIGGANGTSYRAALDDIGHRITVRITGSKQGYATRSQTTAAVGPVTAATLDPTPVPAYSGIAKVGEKLTALPREWGPGEVTLSYQWYRDGDAGGVQIEGATKGTYTQVAADAGHRLKVRVSGSRTGFTTVRMYSGWTSTVAPGDLVAGTPEIDGVAVSGKTLTAETGTWKPAGVTFTYRWYRSGLLITKATADSYTLSGADVGYRITVKVTGKLKGFADKTVESAPTAKVVSRAR